MKKPTVIALTILFIHTLSAQDITARTYVEKTVVASKSGTAIGYIFPGPLLGSYSPVRAIKMGIGLGTRMFPSYVTSSLIHKA